jgi:8-oxo-dGTP pyrophosphatase MutT (NUDIX family)
MDLRQTLAAYTTRFPDQTSYVADFLSLIDQGADVLSRSEFRGHATASALLLNDAGDILLIHHNALNRWLQPGGHLDPTDSDPQSGALRELIEETGIDPALIRPFPRTGSCPLWVDRHWIPANPKKNEPRHEHWDFQYLFFTGAPTLTLQASEVSAHAWHPLHSLAADAAARIHAALST